MLLTWRIPSFELTICTMGAAIRRVSIYSYCSFHLFYILNNEREVKVSQGGQDHPEFQVQVLLWAEITAGFRKQWNQPAVA